MSDVINKFLVGVTGCPGSGKTTVCKLFQDKGARIIDVDDAGRWVVDHSATLRNLLRQEFGDGIFLADGRLDRPKLSALVFADHSKLMQLNRLVHPFMINRVRQMIQAVVQDKDSLPYLVVDMALLFELHMHNEMDYTITVTAPHEQRLERLMNRHGVSLERAEQMTQAQLSQEDKAARADYVLENEDKMHLLHQRVDILHQNLLSKMKL